LVPEGSTRTPLAARFTGPLVLAIVACTVHCAAGSKPVPVMVYVTRLPAFTAVGVNAVTLNAAALATAGTMAASPSSAASNSSATGPRAVLLVLSLRTDGSRGSSATGPRCI
jgi:hypothetical protein